MLGGFGGSGNVLAGFCREGYTGLFWGVTLYWWRVLLTLARVPSRLFLCFKALLSPLGIHCPFVCLKMAVDRFLARVRNRLVEPGFLTWEGY